MDLIDVVEREIDQERGHLAELCGLLVAAESPNPPGRTAGVAAVLRSFFISHAIESELVAANEATPNLVAVLGERDARPHVVLNAHMDTMQPGNVDAWSVPIFELTRKRGRWYGLGMGNMKGGLAAMAVATSVLNRYAPELRGRLSFTAVCDEVMFGARGTEFLLLQRPEFVGDFMISAEGPGYMHFAVAEKGLLWVDVEATGIAGHSSRAMKGETAVARLAAFLAELDSFNETYATLPSELAGVTGGEGNHGLRLSVSTGVIEAGSVRSLIPPSASAKIDIRIPPGIYIPDLKQRLEELVTKNAGLRISFSKGWNASWASQESPLVFELAAAIEQVRGVAPQQVVRLPGSDARHWRDRGVPAVCYGPQPTLSAGVDDYVEEQDVLDCAKIYAITALKLMAL
jgi:succinyl-diaminopimelate desuccinylase